MGHRTYAEESAHHYGTEREQVLAKENADLLDRVRDLEAAGVILSAQVETLTKELGEADVCIDRADGALADAGDIPTGDIERGIRRLTEERDAVSATLLQATEAFNEDGPNGLGVINESVQPLIDAVVAWGDRIIRSGEARVEKAVSHAEKAKAEVARLRGVCAVFVRKGRYHMEQWPDDKEMRGTLDAARALLAQTEPGVDPVTERMRLINRQYETEPKTSECIHGATMPLGKSGITTRSWCYHCGAMGTRKDGQSGPMEWRAPMLPVALLTQTEHGIEKEAEGPDRTAAYALVIAEAQARPGQSWKATLKDLYALLAQTEPDKSESGGKTACSCDWPAVYSDGCPKHGGRCGKGESGEGE
jgi:hypothetical protein